MAIGQGTDSTWSSQKVTGNRAFLLNKLKAPVLAKLLELPFLAQDSFVRTGQQAKIKEVSSPSAILPFSNQEPRWQDLLSALSAPRLDRNTATDDLKDDSLNQIPSNLIREEYAARYHFVDILSASTASEAMGFLHSSHHKTPLEAHYRWLEAKVACRKAALCPTDRSRPWSQALLSSNLWSEGLFGGKELDRLHCHCKDTSRSVSLILGSQRRRFAGPPP